MTSSSTSPTPEALIGDLAFDQAPTALAMTDCELRVLKANQRWRALMGRGEEIVGQSLRDLFPIWCHARAADIEACIAGRPPARTAAAFRRPIRDWPWLEVSIKPWLRPDGQVGGMLSHVVDVTETMVAKTQIEQSERRLQLAVEIANLNVYEVDYAAGTLKSQGAPVEVDPPLSFEVIRDDPWSLVHPDDRDRVIATWQAQTDAGESFRGEYRLPRQDGAEHWVFAGTEVLPGGDPERPRIVGVLQDITVRKQTERALRRAVEAAEAANRAKSEFLANMSHEIRTPLNGVMGVASVLAASELNARQREMVGLIVDSARTLEILLSDILDLARIESGRMTLSDEPFDLVESLRITTALFEPEAARKGLAFQTRIDPALQGLVRGDVTRLRQIVSNLLSNAVKFTLNGQVTLTAVGRRVEGEASRLHLELVVSDTGIGFDEATAARLFQRFEQADGSITRKFGGTGLGLAISRSLAEAMGGRLSAVSRPGEGATFTLTLELPRERAEAAPEAPPLDDAPLAPPRILLAEDHPVNRKVVELMLQPIGADLVCVENGREAFEAAADGFDLILMDMQMPVMDGVTAIRLIREQEARQGRPRTPILALTANAMAEHAEACHAAGADGHLTKPISTAALIAAVREACAPDSPSLARRSGRS